MIFKNILFDLDGTIIEPKEGITKSIQYAMEKLGYEPPDSEDLLWCIGPPLYESFQILFDKKDRDFILHAVDVYREYYSKKGIFEHTLYSGITRLLKQLKSKNFKVFIATSKPGVMAEKIIEYHSFGNLFDGIYGCELDGTNSKKTELLKYLLVKEQLKAEDSLMVGDRKHDIIGGKENSLMTCGVLYGYGSIEELKIAGADFIIEKPDELLSIQR
ncbi:MAG: HAD hydrolase-like protein [Victivallales bacterium]|nr:HAD hydrolase-like protein [Victivallales bacterium]MCF7888760.1 HAD hydrolase-like protein [Victivallales bacterium]